MLISRILCRSLRIALAAVACFALAGPAGAGTVFAWQTEDGTHSFTDQKKQVPARYRDQATSRQVSRMSGYARLTPTPKTAKGSYADRMRARLADLRGEPQTELAAAQAVAGAGIPLAVSTGGSRHGGHATIVPVAAAADSAEPIVIEQRRMRATDSLATRHVTVVRNGERTLVVEKDELSQRSYQGADFPAPRETDFE